MNEQTEKDLKTKHKRLLKLTLAGVMLAFKPLNKAQASQLKKLQTEKPELAVETTINSCKACCVFGAEHFDELANDYPLAFCGGGPGEPGVIDELMKMAHGAVSFEVG